MPKIITIIQARMSSTRLPGKILLPLGEITVLGLGVSRIKKSQRLDAVIVATTDLTSDDVTANYCLDNGIHYFRGNCDNVLERYYMAAKQYGAKVGDLIVRMTSDCPFIDYRILDAMLENFQGDYFSNTLTRSFPRGFDLEIFTFAALEKAYLSAENPSEKEHVTPYIYNHPEMFSLHGFGCDEDNSDLRVTLDTPEDWQVIEQTYLSLSKTNPDFTYQDVIKFLRQNPQVAKLNALVEQKK